LKVVAPRAGAWIETRPKQWRFRSEPVAPRAGAWIETFHNRILRHKPVAPRAGAWIETLSEPAHLLNSVSRAPRGRVD